MTAAQAMPARGTAVRIARGPAALDLLDERWDALLATQEIPNPTLSSAWLREAARWRTGEPLVAAVETEGAFVAGAALELRHGGRLAPRVATWLGPVEQLFSPDVLAAPGHPEAVETLFAAVFEDADVLSLTAPAGGAAAAGLEAVAPWRRITPTTDRWLLPWPAPRLEYAQGRAGYELRRAVRRGAGVEVRIAAEPEEVAAALVRLFRVHRDRWYNRPDETPRFATTATHRRWNRRTVGVLAARNAVRIAEVLEDGHPVAGCIGFLHAHGGLGHTWAVRSDGAIRQPGHVAVLACVEALAAAGATTIDLGITSGGPNSPKARLGSLPDPMVAVFAADARGRQRRYEATRAAVGLVRNTRSALGGR